MKRCIKSLLTLEMIKHNNFLCFLCYIYYILLRDDFYANFNNNCRSTALVQELDSWSKDHLVFDFYSLKKIGIKNYSQISEIRSFEIQTKLC